MSGRARSRSDLPKPPTPTPYEQRIFTRRPKGRRRGALRPLDRPADPRIPEAFEARPIKNLVIITGHSNACECITGKCFRPRFKTPYDLLFTSNYGCPTITYGSFFDVARNLLGNIDASIVHPRDPVNGDVLTRAIYATVSVTNYGKDPTGDWLGAYGTLGRSTNLKFHEKKTKVSNLTIFAPGFIEGQNVNGVYVFPMDTDRLKTLIKKLRDDESIRDFNILNKPEILAQLGIEKNTDEPAVVRPGVFYYPDVTFSRTDGGLITLEYLLNGIKKLTRDGQKLMLPPKGTLVLPLTCRVLEGAPREGMPLVSPTSSQYSQATLSPSSDDFDGLFSDSDGAASPGGGGGGKTRRHIRHRHKITKKYRSRSRSRTKPKSTKKRGRK
jgi:hypothetical protein